jgi:hypothetical protein
MPREQLSCQRCGSAEIRIHPKRAWEDGDDSDCLMCRPCIIAWEIIEHARHRMHIVQYCANVNNYVLHSSQNIETNIRSARTRARRWKLPATLDMADWESAIAFFGDVCAYCGDKWEQIEHVTPLCRGGGSTIANCLPACPLCNKKKRRRTLEELIEQDLWPHRTERLGRILSWLQQHGRTAANPSGTTTRRSSDASPPRSPAPRPPAARDTTP